MATVATVPNDTPATTTNTPPGHTAPNSLHAQLSVIAQLRGSTITDEIRQALQRHIEQVRSDGELTAQAGTVLEEIEREASDRREAIAALFGEPGEPGKPARRTTRSDRTEPD